MNMHMKSFIILKQIPLNINCVFLKLETLFENYNCMENMIDSILKVIYHGGKTPIYADPYII